MAQETENNSPGGRMTRHRRIRIADLMREKGVARVAELAEQFGVSEVTIRNDLIQLEKEGHLIRDRGGAILPETPDEGQVSSLLAFEQRAGLMLEEKRRIGQAAAALVEPGDTIIIDAGTTAVEMVRHLAGISPLTVVTNAFNVAIELGMYTETQVIMLGGTLNRTAASVLGPMTERGLDDLIVQKVFLGTQALSEENGLTDTTMEIAQVKRAMMRAARQVILLTDSSKWNHSGFIKVAPLSAMHMIISDSGLSAEAREAVERAGAELLLV
jgi:DeoR/GlpR family transcriptional regulator of sugar metabolism